MRKLATAALAFSAAVYAANYLLPIEWLILLAAPCAAAGAALALMRRKWLRPLVISLLFFAAGLMCFRFHFQATVEKAKELDGQTHMVSAEVLDFPDVYDDYCRLEVRITSYYLPNFKAILYDNDKQLADAGPGDEVSLRAKLSTADTVYGERYDNYHSKGFYLKLSSKGDMELERSGFDIFTLPKYISKWLSSGIEKLFPDDTEVFMRSLMLGDKDDFYEDESIYVSMSRAGLMHIVAVSGMHISFLVSFLYHLLGRGKRSALICILIIWLFALVTGAGPAVVRAGFMQTTLLMAPVLRRENDPITSLAAILAVILCINPFAATSISLQLSFAAMAGILFFSGRIYKALSKLFGKLSEHGFVRGVLLSVSCSVSVTLLTSPLTAIHFGSVPVLNALSNLISLWAVSYCFCGGWVSCALSWIPCVGELSAWLCSWLARYIFLAADFVSSIPFSVLYMETKGAWLWMLLSYALFFGCLLLRKRIFAAFFTAGFLSALMLAGISYASAEFYRRNETVNVLDVGQGQCISVLTDKATVLLDCGNISNLDDAGAVAGSHLYSRGRDHVDLLLLSHLHADHADGAVMLMEMMEVKTIILPSDYDDSDELYTEIVECAARRGTDVIALSENNFATVGDIGIEIYKSSGGEDGNERCLVTRVKIGEFELLVMADSTAQMERNFAQEQELSTVDALMVSHHGSGYSSTWELLEEIGGDLAFISVGYNNYGHPAEETLERLEACGYNVYRTDKDGDIEIQVGQAYG